jgi:hypothetical protein
MAVPHVSTNFPDQLNPRVQRIFFDTYRKGDDFIPMLYNMVPSNGRDRMIFSQLGQSEDWADFTGTVQYSSQTEGYDTTLTYEEFASGLQAERKLIDDQLFSQLDRKPMALANAAFRTRQIHAARTLNLMNSVASKFYVNTEAVALVSNSHTTRSGASTASGFDNLVTSPLSAAAVTAAQIQAEGFRGDRAERMDVVMDEIWHPVDLYETAYEIIASSGKVDTANNNRNVHEGKYRSVKWNRITDTNNWSMHDSAKRKEQLHWSDRIPIEFAMVESFDEFIAKWRGYMRYALGHTDWRWIIGAVVS